VAVGQTVAKVWQFFIFFKMTAATILDFLKFQNFDGRKGPEFKLRQVTKFCDEIWQFFYVFPSAVWDL